MRALAADSRDIERRAHPAHETFDVTRSFANGSLFRAHEVVERLGVAFMPSE
jgi:hypothetical protein